jgi:cellobiose phosphorylase
MDRPLAYHGGIQTLFQRAETSTYFGREIGLMYFHEHIRYAEAQAKTGRAEAFLRAVRQAVPIAYQDIVPCGDLRQANCYYTSSDVIFKNRYEADERYSDVVAGKMPLSSGWRVYSSGPGIFVALIVSRLLGIRFAAGKIVLDPVMPRSLDGLSASLRLLDRSVTFHYAIRDGSFSPKAVRVNGKPSTPLAYEDNPYRRGGAVLESRSLVAMLDRANNVVEIEL